MSIFKSNKTRGIIRNLKRKYRYYVMIMDTTNNHRPIHIHSIPFELLPYAGQRGGGVNSSGTFLKQWDDYLCGLRYREGAQYIYPLPELPFTADNDKDVLEFYDMAIYDYSGSSLNGTTEQLRKVYESDLEYWDKVEETRKENIKSILDEHGK